MAGSAGTSEKLEHCEVCSAHKAKYTCPKCEVRTCCLTCINIHKKELECDGIRDKTKFIPLNSFTDLDLLSDYRLLESIGRSVEQLQTNSRKKSTRQIGLPNHLHRLKSAAYSKGTILEFLPQDFSRHKENSTYLNWKTNELFWKVELIFPQAENAKWIINRVLETKRISVILEETINPNISSEIENADLLNSLVALKNKLKFYRACGISGLKALLKAEKVMKSNSRFYELDLQLSLQENLKNKTIIEFPVIYVIFKDHSSMFEIIESDDEDIAPIIAEKPLKNRKRNFNATRKSSNQSSSQNKSGKDKDSSVNYFFNAEVSDSEDEDNTNRNCHTNQFQELNIPDYNELVKMDH